ncbi:LysR family transcriptional regulator [Hydrogenophaga sp.]|uniref:LysR family transcriptional regulator n=1 Tax=Hydrogenophaga sp. TaxID=1904254 RepID=UPI003569A589
MKKNGWSELAAFSAVAKLSSFRQAADELGVSASAVSHSVRVLETRLGVRLLHRSTRSVAPTEAGARLLARLSPALDDIEQALGELDAFRDQPRGRLRLTVPRIAAQCVVLPLLPGFLARYPEIEVEVVGDDGLVDIVAGGFDAGMRFGERLAADLVAVPFGAPAGFCVVAAPSYLAGREPPRSPADLLQHLCVRQRFPSGVLYRWEFARQGERQEVALPRGPVFNDQFLVVEAAVAGLGLTYAFNPLVQSHVAEGRLQTVLGDWMPAPERLYLYTPGRRQMPAPLRAFLDYAQEQATPAR